MDSIVKTAHQFDRATVWIDRNSVETSSEHMPSVITFLL